MANQTLKLTTPIVERAEFPIDISEYFLCDTEVKGLQLRVTRTKKAWTVRRYLNGSQVRYKIGEFPIIGLQMARDKAKLILADIQQGVNPNEKRKEVRKAIATRKTLAEFTVETMLSTYSYPDRTKPNGEKALGVRTIKDLENLKRKLEAHCPWFYNTPFNSLTDEKIQKAFLEITAGVTSKKATNGGKTTANQGMAYLRASAQYAIRTMPAFKGMDNPFSTAMHENWHQKQSRDVTLGLEDFPKWWQGVADLRNSPSLGANHKDTIPDFLLVALLTCARRSELLSLEWGDVDFSRRSFLLRNTKNKKAHAIPMASFCFSIFERRLEANQDVQSRYVFWTSRGSETGHIVTVEKAVERLQKLSGVDVVPHDLRRTGATLLSQSETTLTVGQVLNHTLPAGSGALPHYLHSKVELIRPVFDDYEKRVLILAGVLKDTSNNYQVSQEDWQKLQELKRAQTKSG
jgi:integrase